MSIHVRAMSGLTSFGTVTLALLLPKIILACYKYTSSTAKVSYKLAPVINLAWRTKKKKKTKKNKIAKLLPANMTNGSGTASGAYRNNHLQIRSMMLGHQASDHERGQSLFFKTNKNPLFFII